MWAVAFLQLSVAKHAQELNIYLKHFHFSFSCTVRLKIQRWPEIKTVINAAIRTLLSVRLRDLAESRCNILFKLPLSAELSCEIWTGSRSFCLKKLLSETTHMRVRGCSCRWIWHGTNEESYIALLCEILCLVRSQTFRTKEGRCETVDQNETKTA